MPGQRKNDYINVSTKKNNDHFVFEIEYNALSIAKNLQSKILSIFKRRHPKISYSSGLGLYMIKKSACILNGDIIYLDTGEGSTVRVRLPL
jgi:light-regulated signal transduction histidine kinase (bacteriophytochrome)